MNISSTENKIVKLTASLSEKKYRDKEACYIIEGPNLVREAILQGGRVRFIFTGAEQESDEVREIVHLALEKGLAVYETSGNVFAKISQTQSPQGILAVMEKPHCTVESFFAAVGDKNVLVLDRVQDPGNMGTLLRCAEAAGMGGVVIVKGCGDVFSPKTVRAAAGSIARVPLYFAAGPAEAVSLLRSSGKRICATAMEGSIDYYNCNFKGDCAIVIGNEGNGVDADFLIGADEIISIPMEGLIESLNAGLAGGIIMYEAMRQQRTDK